MRAKESITFEWIDGDYVVTQLVNRLTPHISDAFDEAKVQEYVSQARLGVLHVIIKGR